jgi:hypothetical protein
LIAFHYDMAFFNCVILPGATYRRQYPSETSRRPSTGVGSSDSVATNVETLEAHPAPALNAGQLGHVSDNCQQAMEKCTYPSATAKFTSTKQEKKSGGLISLAAKDDSTAGTIDSAMVEQIKREDDYGGRVARRVSVAYPAGNNVGEGG